MPKTISSCLPSTICTRVLNCTNLYKIQIPLLYVILENTPNKTQVLVQFCTNFDFKKYIFVQNSIFKQVSFLAIFYFFGYFSIFLDFLGIFKYCYVFLGIELLLFWVFKPTMRYFGLIPELGHFLATENQAWMRYHFWGISRG